MIKKHEAFKIPLKNKTQQASMYTGVGRKTIIQIREEDKKRNKTDPEKPLSSPGKQRHRLSIIQKVDDFNFTVIRNTIEKFYLRLKIVPTTQALLMKIKQTIEFPYSNESLRLLLKANGFYWHKCQK